MVKPVLKVDRLFVQANYVPYESAMDKCILFVRLFNFMLFFVTVFGVLPFVIVLAVKDAIPSDIIVYAFVGIGCYVVLFLLYVGWERIRYNRRNAPVAPANGVVPAAGFERDPAAVAVIDRDQVTPAPAAAVAGV